MPQMRVIVLLTVLGALLPASASAGLSPLDAISMIESGNNDSAVGPAGEVSRYQIRPRVWRQFSESPAYDNARVAEWVAQQYMTWLANFYAKRAGRSADDFDLYVMWNGGPTYYQRIGFSKERVHPIIRNRALRYVNLRQMQTTPPAGGASATVRSR